MYYGGGASNNINAQIEADRLAAGHPRETDPADERAERMTRAARIVVGAAAVIGFTWFVAGNVAALIAAGVVGMVALVFALLRRIVNKAEIGR